jgi:hypothetical protein
VRHVVVPVFCVLSLAIQSCSDPDSVQLFTAEQATAVAKEFQRALAANDDAALAAVAGAPFRWQSRTWRTDAEVAANLKKEADRVRHLHAKNDAFEAFSRFDLQEGRWPRQEAVDGDKRAARIEALGVPESGWFVRVHGGGRPGYTLVLRPEGATKLVVAAVDL